MTPRPRLSSQRPCGRVNRPGNAAVQPRPQLQCGIQYSPDCRDDNRLVAAAAADIMLPIKKSRSKSKSMDMYYLQYGSTRWTEKLIELVLEQPALYNHGHADYRNIAVRDLIWESIGVTLQTTGKLKSKLLRSSYVFLSRIECMNGGAIFHLSKWLPVGCW